MNASPYMPTMGDRTINPSNIPMQNNQVQPPPRSQSVNMESVNGVAPQHLHSMLPGAGPAPVMVQAADKVLKPMPKTAGKSGGSMSSSDDDLEIEGEDDPEVRPAIITIAKPAGDNYRDRLLWEVVDSVWSPRNRPAPTEKIIAAIKFVAEAVRGLREHWKSQNEKLKKAELPNSETSAHAPALKQMVGQYRELMETLATRVTKWGHPSILKRYVFSSHPKLIHTCTIFTRILLIALQLHNVFDCLSVIMILEILPIRLPFLHLNPGGLARSVDCVMLAWTIIFIDSSISYHPAVSETTVSSIR